MLWFLQPPSGPRSSGYCNIYVIKDGQITAEPWVLLAMACFHLGKGREILTSITHGALFIPSVLPLPHLQKAFIPVGGDDEMVKCEKLLQVILTPPSPPNWKALSQNTSGKSQDLNSFFSINPPPCWVQQCIRSSSLQRKINSEAGSYFLEHEVKLGSKRWEAKKGVIHLVPWVSRGKEDSLHSIPNIALCVFTWGHSPPDVARLMISFMVFFRESGSTRDTNTGCRARNSPLKQTKFTTKPFSFFGYRYQRDNTG